MWSVLFQQERIWRPGKKIKIPEALLIHESLRDLHEI
jgi:hypothetical protein